MVKVVCGSAPLKKGERRGSMKECLDKGQVRYCGLNKVDSRMISKSKNKTETTFQKMNKLIIIVKKYEAKLIAMKKKFKEIKNKKSKQNI